MQDHAADQLHVIRDHLPFDNLAPGCPGLAGMSATRIFNDCECFRQKLFEKAVGFGIEFFLKLDEPVVNILALIVRNIKLELLLKRDNIFLDRTYMLFNTCTKLVGFSTKLVVINEASFAYSALIWSTTGSRLLTSFSFFEPKTFCNNFNINF